MNKFGEEELTAKVWLLFFFVYGIKRKVDYWHVRLIIISEACKP